MDENIFGNGIPMGFSMALAQNTDAFQAFTNLSEEDKLSILNGAKGINSKSEMRAYVDNLNRGYSN